MSVKSLAPFVPGCRCVLRFLLVPWSAVPLLCRAASLLILSLQSNWLISILLDCVAAAPSPLCSSQACSGLQINILGFLVMLNICIYQVF